MKAEIIDTSKKRDDIISLWQDVFNDDRKYIEFFLDNIKHMKCIGVNSGDKLVSMLFLLDATITDLSGAYVYAVATNKDFRRKGLMGLTLNFAKSMQYDFLSLVPAEKYLFDVYKKFGFVNNLYCVNNCKMVNDCDIINIAEFDANIEQASDLPILKINDRNYIYNENINSDGFFCIKDGVTYAVRYGKVYECSSAKEFDLIGMTSFKDDKKMMRGRFGLYLD